MVKGLKSGKIASGNRKVNRARQLCKVCSKLFDFALIDGDSAMVPGLCATCKKQLSDGYIALVQGDRYAFVKSDRLSDKAGEIIAVSQKTMDEVAKQFDIAIKARNEGSPE